MTRLSLALVLFVGGCWKDAPPARITTASKPAPAAPPLCPETRLREFAAAIDAGVEEIQVAPTGRQANVLHVKCPRSSSDEACVAHARVHAVVPAGWEISTIAIDNSGDIIGYEVELDVDGAKDVAVYPSQTAAVDRAKTLQSQGKRVTMVRGEAKRGGGDRVANVGLFGPPGPVQRTAKIHKMPTGDVAATFQELQHVATERSIEILTMASGPKTIELLVGCSRE